MKVFIKKLSKLKLISEMLWQYGTYTIKAGKQYKIQTKDLCKQAKLANIDYKSNR